MQEQWNRCMDLQYHIPSLNTEHISKKSSNDRPHPSVENTSQIRNLNGFSRNSGRFCTSVNDKL